VSSTRYQNLKYNLKVIATLIVMGVLTTIGGGCSQAYRAKTVAWATGNGAVVKVYSGGQVVETIETDNKPFSEEGSDGYYLVNKKTGKLVEVSADVVIEYK
jgi:hypothetical protein